MECVVATLIAAGYFCMGYLWCFNKHVERKLEEIFRRGYEAGQKALRR